MGILQDLVRDVPLPRMVKVFQRFPDERVNDIPAALRREIAKPGVGDTVRPGMRIAIAVGSRGVAEIQTIARITVDEIKSRGGLPFIVPAMGSHGGATAEGQQQILAELGVTEETMGCPILSSMDVVEVGKLDNGLAVLIDKNAYEADGIVVINRVKTHTAFHGACESGMAKMITIGLGKQKGADSCHAYSFKYMSEHIIAMTRIKVERTRILFGIGTVENAYDKVAKITAVPAKDIISTDQTLLKESKALMPRIMFNPIEVLIVDRIGKEISGDGMDPNITGRYPTPYASGGPTVNKLVVLDLTDKTHGNANGMGAADFTTRKLFDKVDWDYTYANALTSTICEPIRVPMVLASDEEAIRAAIKTSFARDLATVRLIRIKDTLHMGEIGISEGLLAEAQANPDIEVRGEPREMRFDDKGNLLD